MSNRSYYIAAVFVMILISFNVFYRLADYPPQDWDESRHGISAYEMIMNNNYITHSYLNQKDMWNLKPPLGFWPITLSYRVFGCNMLGLRFPSALFAVLTVLLTMLIARKTAGNFASIMAGVILAATQGFIFLHSARTGDFDTFFTMLNTLCVFFMLLTEKNRNYIYLCALCIAAAFLAKSFAAVQTFFVLVVFLAVTGEWKNYKPGQAVVFILCLVLPVAAWAAARYQQDGLVFFRTMFSYDLVARSTRPLEGHTGNILFYFRILDRIGLWPLFLPSLYFIWKEKQAGRCTTAVLVWIGVCFFIMSCVRTKGIIYAHVLYPAIAIMLGHGISAMWGVESIRKKFRYVLAAAFVIFGLFAEIVDYQRLVKEASAPQPALLTALPRPQNRNKTILFSGRNFSQAEYFTLEVLLGYKVEKMQDMFNDEAEFFKKSPAGSLLAVKKTGAAYKFRSKVVLKNPEYIVYKN